MFSDYQYAYLLGVLLILAPMWLVLFFVRKDLRREILFVSIFCGILGPISQLWYLQDYWRPETFMSWPIGPEDFLFGFFAGGIASTTYEVLFNKHFIRRKKKPSPFVVPAVCATSIAITLYSFTSLNSIYIGVLFFFISACIILFYRTDLLSDMLVSGCLGGIVVVGAYTVFLIMFPGIFEAWWKLHNLSGIFLWRIPIEEILWVIGFGLVAGPGYEFVTGKVFTR